MKKARKQLAVKFVEFIPEILDEETLYVSMEYATTSHLCACGCGREVVTPLSPVGWQLLYDGESVTLTPSIGNWSFPCHSHYFIRESWIVWAEGMSQIQIETGRKVVKNRTMVHFSAGGGDRHFTPQTTGFAGGPPVGAPQEAREASCRGVFGVFVRWIKGWF